MDPDNNQQIFPASDRQTDKKSSGSLAAVISFAVFILSALGVIIFLYSQNQSLKEKLAMYQVTPSPVPILSPSPEPSSSIPNVSTPAANSKIKSPLSIKGTIPAEWMFEGTFPIKLLDSDKKIIAQTGGAEVVPGSWMEGGMVEFTATLTFKNSSGSGTLVIENDNPSGLSENSKTFEIPIKF